MSDLPQIEERLRRGGGIIQVNSYLVHLDLERNFIQFDRHSSGKRELTGWKFHISTVPEDMPRAFDIIEHTLDRHDISTFKVACEHQAQRFGDPTSHQAGKMFTIYHGGEPNFTKAMQSIERQLARAGIQPGHNVRGDRSVPGSRYLHYRNDGSGSDGPGYISAARRAGYNPTHTADPFADLVIPAASAEGSRLRDNRLLQAGAAGIAGLLVGAGAIMALRPSDSSPPGIPCADIANPGSVADKLAATAGDIRAEAGAAAENAGGLNGATSRRIAEADEQATSLEQLARGIRDNCLTSGDARESENSAAAAAARNRARGVPTRAEVQARNADQRGGIFRS